MNVSFLSLLKSVASRKGLSYEDGQVPDAEARAVAQALTQVCRVVYDFYPWPWTCYYVQTTGDDSLYLDPLSKLLDVWKEDPVAAWAAGRGVPARVKFLEMGDGVRLLNAPGVEVTAGTPTPLVNYELWLLYQRGAPRFDITPYDDATYYDAGDVIFTGTKDCRRAQVAGLGSEITADGRWLDQTVPEELEQTVLAGVEQWFAGTDGRPMGAQALRLAMQERMEETMRALIETRGQYTGQGPGHR